jgi:hypothetical protein
MIDPLGGSPLPSKCTTPDRLGLWIFMYLYGLRPEGLIQRTYLYISSSHRSWEELLSYIAYYGPTLIYPISVGYDLEVHVALAFSY